MAFLKSLKNGLPLDPLPHLRPRDQSLPHAPIRNINFSTNERKLAVKNSLRYFPPKHHQVLAPEFAKELDEYGHIYMYRFLPTFPIKAYPVNLYSTQTTEGAVIIHMILNNLDPEVAQYPHELVTYGGNGQVFSNWAQFWLVMKYLCTLKNGQTLVLNSGHPLGLFPSCLSSPKVVISNGMVIPNYSTRSDYDKMFGLGVTLYGQMTAGSFCYIGPQGIVHGTTLTLLNAGRKYLGSDILAGKAYLSSGLGGMSGAQAKAAVICGCVGIIAEVDHDAIKKRYNQKWLKEIIYDLDVLIARIRLAKKNKEATSIGFHGNVVAVWERLVTEFERTGECLVELGSDQTSCHIPFNGGYYPVQLSYSDAKEMMVKDEKRFQELVKESLCKQIAAIGKLSHQGMKFWDYGNAFLLEAGKAGADVGLSTDSGVHKFRYPSYMQDIMGDIFALGFGPFRWVCTSGSSQDLSITDNLALEVLQDTVKTNLPDKVKQQYMDNIHWMKQAMKQELVVGSQARILYSDQMGRIAITLAFNKAIRESQLSGPVVITRDHHDVSGTDSPFRETSNLTDGSSYTADMSVQNCIGDAFRGATWVALHNGGGVGWGEVINGGFGLVLDGSEDIDHVATVLLSWDVNNGVARRAWTGDKTAYETARRAMHQDTKLQVTLPFPVNQDTL